MAVTIRKAVKSDMPTVFQMMIDLATSLNEKGPQFTLADLYRDGGFDDRNIPFFFAFLAEDSEKKNVDGSPTAIGFALCSYSLSFDGRTIFLRNLFVHEAYRSQGNGKLFFKAIMRYAKEIGATRLELHVSSSNSAQQFYKKMGAINVTERDGYLFFALKY